jgi:uncharacterized protein YciW
MSQPSDLLEAIIGVETDSPLARLRALRPDIVRHTQGSYDVLLYPADPGGLSEFERAMIALRTAELSGHAALAAHYRDLSAERGGSVPSARLETIRNHVALVTENPRSATPSNIAALHGVGLSPRDVVALTQIVAFVSYQARAAIGLGLLAQEMAS